jgi:radical SAM superfamily enzyme YgiQ (UPF0313 family)
LSIEHSILTSILLVSTYDLGRQPFGLASPAAWLRDAGHDVRCIDLTRAKLDESAVREARLIGFFLPMHTATRMALPVMDQVRAINPSAHIAAYGLYAPLNAEILRGHGVQTILGPEFESDLVELADDRLNAEATRSDGEGPPSFKSRGFRLQAEGLARLQFKAPDRSDLPSLSKYASLQVGDTRRVVGYTEASRGCKHRCRHCPIVPVYDGRFRVVSVDVVMADIAAQVGAGAEHITFGDPDFFNGPRHAIAIAEKLHKAFPQVSYDVTIKVEHLVAERALLPLLRDTNCAFVVSAVESIDDAVLGRLEKGHTRADFEAVVAAFAEVGLTLSPTFVAFTPWTTLEGYCELLQAIDRLRLVPAVAPIQYAIRLLIPQGSRMLELEDVRARISHFDPRSLTYLWRHADPRVDALQRDLEAIAGSNLNALREEMFARVWTLAHEAAGLFPPPREPLAARSTVPYLNEPWYC